MYFSLGSVTVWGERKKDLVNYLYFSTKITWGVITLPLKMERCVMKASASMNSKSSFQG